MFMRKVSIVAISLFFLTSCETAQLNRETVTAEENSVAESLFEDIQLSVDDNAKALNDTSAVDSNGVVIKGDSLCPCVEWTPNWVGLSNFLKFPKTITIDFGEDGCEGQDGRIRRGIVTGTFSNWPWVRNARLDIVREKYFVDDYKVEGTKSITYRGENLSGNRNWDISVVDGVITTPDGETILWESERNNELISGANDWDPWNNVYSITGMANGTNTSGRDYTAEIIKALIVKIGCLYVTEGVLEIQPEDLKVRSIDYGDGTCDRKAEVTIGKRTYDVNL